MSQPDPQTALLLIAHGSREPEANADLHALAKRLLEEGNYSIVLASYLELAEPSISDGARRCIASGAQRVVLLPYFLAAGVHVRRDLAAHRAQLAADFPGIEFLLAEALGPHNLLDRIVIERAREAERQGSVQHRA